MSHPPAHKHPIAAFAYLRRLPGMDKKALRQTVEELAAFNRRQGLALAGVFYEERIGDRLSIWCELIAACRTERVANVVVPSSQHFHRTPEVAAFMRDELATSIQGTVLLVTEADAVATSDSETPDAH